MTEIQERLSDGGRPRGLGLAVTGALGALVVWRLAADHVMPLIGLVLLSGGLSLGLIAWARRDSDKDMLSLVAGALVFVAFAASILTDAWLIEAGPIGQRDK